MTPLDLAEWLDGTLDPRDANKLCAAAACIRAASARIDNLEVALRECIRVLRSPDATVHDRIGRANSAAIVLSQHTPDRDGWHEKYETLAAQVRAWNEAVESIIGRVPDTGIEADPAVGGKR